MDFQLFFFFSTHFVYFYHCVHWNPLFINKNRNGQTMALQSQKSKQEYSSTTVTLNVNVDICSEFKYCCVYGMRSIYVKL